MGTLTKSLFVEKKRFYPLSETMKKFQNAVLYFQQLVVNNSLILIVNLPDIPFPQNQRSVILDRFPELVSKKTGLIQEEKHLC